MKKTLAIVLALVMVLALVACSGKTGTETPAPQTGTETKTDTSSSPLAGTYDITVWVGEAAVDLTKKQIDDFNKNNELGITFNAIVNGVSSVRPPGAGRRPG